MRQRGSRNCQGGLIKLRCLPRTPLANVIGGPRIGVIAPTGIRVHSSLWNLSLWQNAQRQNHEDDESERDEIKGFIADSCPKHRCI